MGFSGLQCKIIMWVLIPLIGGILVTALISNFTLRVVNPIWMTTSNRDLIEREKLTMKSISSSLSQYLLLYFQRAVDDQIYISEYIKKLRNELSDKTKTYDANIKRMLDGIDEKKKEFPQQNKTSEDPRKPNKNYSLWFAGDIKSAGDPASITYRNKKLAANIDLVAFPFYKYDPIRKRGGLKIMFEEDGSLYVYPYNLINITAEFKTSSYCSFAATNEMDGRCHNDFLEMKIYNEIFYRFENVSEYFIFFSTPRLITNVDTIYYIEVDLCTTFVKPIPENKDSASYSYYYTRYLPEVKSDIQNFGKYTKNTGKCPPSTTDNLTPFKMNYPKINTMVDFVICQGLSLKDLAEYLIETTYTKQKIYFYVINSQTQEVIYHPKYLQNPDLQKNSSISDLEFPDDPTGDEACKFNETILSEMLNNTAAPSSTNFTRKNVTHYININQIKVQKNFSNETRSHIFTMALVGNETTFLEPFMNITTSVQEDVVRQGYILLGVILGIAVLSFAFLYFLTLRIIKPIDQLVTQVRKAVNGDYEIDLYSNFTETSHEVNLMYKTFQKLLNVLKYANSSYFEGSEAKTIINYAEALKLFEDLGNKKGMGVIYNNLGNLLLKHQRYKEAVDLYRKSVEVCEKEIEEYKKCNKLVRFEELTIKRRTVKGRKRKSVDITQEKVSLQETLANRKFQLANSLWLKAMAEGNVDKEDLNDAIKYLKQVLNHEKDLKSFNSRALQARITLSQAYLEIENDGDSENNFEEAEKELKDYEELWNDAIKKSKQPEDTPPIIFHQKILASKGLLNKRRQFYKEAANLFTQCLETGDIYDPEIRKLCLEQLKEIFEQHDLLDRVPNINKMIEINFIKRNNNDIVFLLDMSESMDISKRKYYALREILKFFDKYMDPLDRIGFIRFNHNVEVIFELSERGKNEMYLRNAIQTEVQCIGETALYIAIYEGLKLHKKAEKKENNKWVVCLTDGEDNASGKVISEKALESRIKNTDINLIIIGLALNPSCIEQLRRLCQLTKNGVFIETAEDVECIEVAFQAMKKSITDLTLSKNLIVENFGYDKRD